MSASATKSQRGVALVITLIFLSIITFMAVTFLVVSQHASQQVESTTHQVVAKQAAEAATEAAEARIISTMLGNQNGFNFGLMVSTNYQSPFFDTTQPSGTINVANVNYYDNGGVALPANSSSYLQMLNNLMVLPRPPVFVGTNKDFRFYLDLNRNGVFDSNGPVTVLNQFGNQETNFVGDPEWIGILEHPDQPHSRTNQFIARYIVFAQPIGNSLDANYIGNQSKQIRGGNNPAVDGFLRNQGVGSWEINLAGFLTGLNSNYWNYDYQPFDSTGNINPNPSLGTAFDVSALMLQFRYGGSYASLNSFSTLYGGTAGNLFGTSGIDGYAFGPLGPATNLSGPFTGTDDSALPWSGSDSPDRFFTDQDLFITENSPYFQPGLNVFSNSLVNAGLGNASAPFGPTGDANFGRYTFYRMLSQMGVESAPEPAGKLNLNYVNAGGFAAANFIPWGNQQVVTNSSAQVVTNNAALFFTNAADRLLGSQTNFIIGWNSTALIANFTNLSSHFIPIYPVNYYSPAVHRELQLSANIYDAVVNNSTAAPSDFDYPSVFRPTFAITNTTDTNGNVVSNIIINGYVEVTNTDTNNPDYNLPIFSLPEDAAAMAGSINSGNGSNINLYGVPWVIGAKKGYPNFNQIGMQSYSQISRKVEIVKPSLSAARGTWQTNIQYILGFSNLVSVQMWNSYMATYPRQVDIFVNDTVGITVTNQNVLVFATNAVNPFAISVASWPGIPANFQDTATLSNSFKVPVYNANYFLPPSILRPNGALTLVSSVANGFFDTNTGFPLPLFGMTVTNKLRLAMVDHASGRVIDYVQLNGMSDQRNLMDDLVGLDGYGPGGVWGTNRLGGLTDLFPFDGVNSQVQASLQAPPYSNPNFGEYPTPLTQSDWQNMLYPPPNFSSVSSAVAAFSAFYNKNTNSNSQLAMQVPYTPTRSANVYFTWQANDPLVHYTLDDLTGLGDFSTKPVTNYTFTNLVLRNLWRPNDRYRPWGSSLNGVTNDEYTFNMALKDPLITRSDDWQFPDGKMPNIGWLGRVHRGTPWQTVYMKPPPTDPNFFQEWQNWTGNSNNLDAAAAQPTSDQAIFDLFTTAPNDNATRGQLSINQPNFAAWAAMLDGVIAVANDPTNGLVPLIIDPNTNGAALAAIVNGINSARANPNRPGRTFTRLGDILSVPELTVNSPFLNMTNGSPLNDAAYERLPQQIMSLLRVGSPRYVIYAYGQSLKPALNSIVTGGPFYGTCTNYQITGEVVTRTVVRFESPSLTNAISPSDTNSWFYAPLNPTHNPVMPQMLRDANGFPIAPPNPPIRAVIENYNELPPE